MKLGGLNAKLKKYDDYKNVPFDVCLYKQSS